MVEEILQEEKIFMIFLKWLEEHDVIVVTINYRLGPLGWFTHPSIQENQDGIDKTSNFGTLDIIQALKMG